jgi:predicted Zn finger-like uncharacterized protein
MIITCPNCQTRYSLPQDKIRPGGQKVRCAKCGTVWHQAPEEIEAVAPAVPPDEPALPPGPAEPPASPPTDDAPAPLDPSPEPPPETATAAPGPLVDAPADPTVEPMSRFRASAEPAPRSGAGRKWAIAAVVVLIAAGAAALLFRERIEALTGLRLHAPTPAETAAPAPTSPPAPVVPTPPPFTLTLEQVESFTEEVDGIKRLVVKGVIANPDDREQAIPPLAIEMRDAAGNRLDVWQFTVPMRALAPRTSVPFRGERDLPPSALHMLVPGFALPGAGPVEAPDDTPPAAAAAPATSDGAEPPAPAPTPPTSTN